MSLMQGEPSCKGHTALVVEAVCPLDSPAPHGGRANGHREQHTRVALWKEARTLPRARPLGKPLQSWR